MATETGKACRSFIASDEPRRVGDTNIVGTIYLVQQVGNLTCSRRRGRILLTGAIAGFMPRSYQAIYNDTKAFIEFEKTAQRVVRYLRSLLNGNETTLSDYQKQFAGTRFDFLGGVVGLLSMQSET